LASTTTAGEAQQSTVHFRGDNICVRGEVCFEFANFYFCGWCLNCSCTHLQVSCFSHLQRSCQG
jgi:hypothetical protein